jgi:predicted O-methyltransferase YrrM
MPGDQREDPRDDASADYTSAMSWWVTLTVLLVLLLVLLALAVVLRWQRAMSARLWRIERRVRTPTPTHKDVRELTASFSNLAKAVRRHQSAVVELSRATDRERDAHARAIDAQSTALRDEIARAVKVVRAGGLDDVAQVEAFAQLLRLADVREALPRTRGFPVSPDTLLALVDLIRERRPSCYLDLGSGTSTVVAASAARAAGLDMRVIALDHDPAYAAGTRALAARHGLADVVDVRLAPLVPLASDPERRWYDPAALEGLTGIDLCFVDGPPGSINAEARHPAMEFLAGRLSVDAVVALDDTGRADERDLADRWAARPEVREVRRPVAEKGLTVLVLGPERAG